MIPQKIRRSLALLVMAWLLNGCERAAVSAFDDIGAIVANPTAWEGKSVRVRGKVCGQYSLLGLSASGYELCSETTAASIFVLSSGNAPSSDASLIVVGDARSVIVAGSVAVGLHLKERTRLRSPRLGNT